MHDRITLYLEREDVRAGTEPLRVQDVEILRTRRRTRTVEKHVTGIQGPERYGFRGTTVDGDRVTLMLPIDTLALFQSQSCSVMFSARPPVACVGSYSRQMWYVTS